MKISVRFAVDRDGSKTIQKDEVVKKLEELRSEDRDGNDILEGAELKDVYFEYSKDTWLSGGRQHRLDRDGATYRVKLNEVGLEPPRIDMKVDISM